MIRAQGLISDAIGTFVEHLGLRVPTFGTIKLREVIQRDPYLWVRWTNRSFGNLQAA